MKNIITIILLSVWFSLGLAQTVTDPPTGGGGTETDPVWTSEKSGYVTETEINGSIQPDTTKTDVITPKDSTHVSIDSQLVVNYGKGLPENAGIIINVSGGSGEILTGYNILDNPVIQLNTLGSGHGFFAVNNENGNEQFAVSQDLLRTNTLDINEDGDRFHFDYSSGTITNTFNSTSFLPFDFTRDGGNYIRSTTLSNSRVGITMGSGGGGIGACSFGSSGNATIPGVKIILGTNVNTGQGITVEEGTADVYIDNDLYVENVLKLNKSGSGKRMFISGGSGKDVSSWITYNESTDHTFQLEIADFDGSQEGNSNTAFKWFDIDGNNNMAIWMGGTKSTRNGKFANLDDGKRSMVHISLDENVNYWKNTSAVNLRIKKYTGYGGQQGRLLMIDDGTDDFLAVEANGDVVMDKNLNVGGKANISEIMNLGGITTTERDALTPVAGDIIFNTTTSKHQGYDGSSWNDLY